MTDAPQPIADDLALRLAAVRAQLRAQEIDCAIVMGPEAQYWICGHDSFLGALIPQALVIDAGGRPPAFVVWDADVAIARDSSNVADLRTFRFGVDEPARLFVEVAQELGAPARRVGIDLGSRAVPYGFGRELAGHLAGSDIVDITPALARLRMVKTPAELALMRRAGAYGRLGLAAARRHALPGVSEIAVAAEIEYAMRRAGSDYCSIPTEMTSGPRSLQGHGTPGARLLEPGDLLHLEVGGVERRYNAVSMQTLVVPGAPARPAAQELYDVALRCLRTGLAQLRPGIPAAEVEAPALEVIRQAGLGEVFKMRFGYGVGIGYPPSWLEALQITRTSDERLVVGTTFVLHCCLLDEAERLGVLVGGTYVITPEGFECLGGAGDVELA